MAKSFYYPVATATITDGNRDEVANGATTYTFTSGDTVTNEHRISDESIGLAISGFGSDDVLRFDLGASYACDVIAIYMSASDTSDMELYYGSSSTDMGTSATMPITTTPPMTDTFSTGWNVRTFTEATKQYWFVRASGDIAPSEIIIGKKYDFDVNFDLNNTESDISGSDVITSYGGNEFSNKRHSQKATWSWSWSNISSAMKTSLDTMKTAVEINRLKFVYYDETNYHYVRMSGLDFTEVAFQRYSTSMSLTEQLQ